jgi:5-formyltetrahydrofolate cyclo-ligase
VEEKETLRRIVLARREAESGRDEASRRIMTRVLDLPEFQAARCLAAFIGVRSEVTTAPIVARALALGKRVVLPRVAGPEIELREIRSLDELVDGPFGLREPPEDPGRRADLARLDLLLVPGVAFDAAGGRLGHGKGYYDRLLRRVPPEAARVALGFECQVVERVPMGPADERVDLLVTEAVVRRVSPARTASAGP